MARLQEAKKANTLHLTIKKRQAKNPDSAIQPIRPAISSPNRMPGKWLQGASISKITSENISMCQEEKSIDEFYETNEKLDYPTENLSPEKYVIDVLTSATLDDFNPRVVPHMTEPLLPNDSPLDFSCILPQKGMTNINTASPLARVWEFNTKIDIDECSLLNIFADEFENLSCAEIRSKNFWHTIRRFTFGVSDDEYDGDHPWAKYGTRKSEFEDE